MSMPVIGGYNAPQAIVPQQEMQGAAGAAQGNPAQQAVQAPPPPPAPLAHLENARAAFPGIRDAVLTGAEALAEPGDSLGQLLDKTVFSFRRADRPPPDLRPLVLSDGLADKPRLALMPAKGVPGKNAAEKQGNIRAWVMEGKQTYQEIMSGELTPDKTGAIKEKELAGKVSGLMWYIQALASAKAGETAPVPFRDGMIHIEDDADGRLQGFFESLNCYERPGPHLAESSKGVDLRKSVLPGGARSLQFGRLPGDNGGERMLYLKMEPHGCRGISAHAGLKAHARHNPFRGVKRLFLSIKDAIAQNHAAKRMGNPPGIAAGGEVVLTRGGMGLSEVAAVRPWDGKTALTMEGGMSDEWMRLAENGIEYRLLDRANDDVWKIFEKDANRGNFVFTDGRVPGPDGNGETVSVSRNAADSLSALRDLAKDGAGAVDEEVARMLMSLVNQSFVGDIGAAFIKEATLNGVAYHKVGAGRSEYGIRRAASEGAEQRYELTWTSRGEMGIRDPGSGKYPDLFAPRTGGDAVRLDPAASKADASMRMELVVTPPPDRRMSARFLERPSFSTTMVPSAD